MCEKNRFDDLLREFYDAVFPDPINSYYNYDCYAEELHKVRELEDQLYDTFDETQKELFQAYDMASLSYGCENGFMEFVETFRVGILFGIFLATGRESPLFSEAKRD